MTHMKCLFTFGYGYVAHFLAETLRAKGDEWEIAGTTRDSEKLKKMRALGIRSYLFDEEHHLADPYMALQDVTHVLLTIPPGDDGDPAFTAHADDLVRQMPKLEWVGLLSTTAVYGDRDGAVVDEGSELRPTNKRGSRRAMAESQWLVKYSNDRLPLHIFRLSGIYGPGRSALDAVRVGNSRRIYKPGHAFSRIHVDDIVQILQASMAKPQPGQAYNVSDDSPSPSHELIKMACEMLNMPVPPLQMFDDVDMAPMARSFYLDNKRISNRKIKEQLGITLKYPSYREGLPACLAGEQSAVLARLPMETGGANVA